MEPFKLRPWKISVSPGCDARFYTCARPGRSKGPDGAVPDDVVSSWVRGLPGPDTAIISLLGCKPDENCLSEYSFYSFGGAWDRPEERGGRPYFQEWLDQNHKELNILVRERPTNDNRPISSGTIEAIATDVHELNREGRTVVVMDSGGVGRTGDVVAYLKAIQDT